MHLGEWVLHVVDLVLGHFGALASTIQSGLGNDNVSWNFGEVHFGVLGKLFAVRMRSLNDGEFAALVNEVCWADLAIGRMLVNRRRGHGERVNGRIGHRRTFSRQVWVDWNLDVGHKAVTHHVEARRGVSQRRFLGNLDHRRGR